MNSFLDQYPELIAIAVALVGFVVAAFVSRWFDQLLDLFERGVRRLSPLRADQFATLTPRKLIQQIVYYVTLAFFLLLAVRLLGITALTDWLDLVIAYIPQLLLGGVIIVGGYLLSILVHGIVASAIDDRQGELLPRLAQGLVILIAVMTALDQMSVEVSFIASVITILLATTFGGLALAFGLGARDLVGNILARRTITTLYTGDRIRIGETEGTVVELTPTAVLIENDHGTVSIPASRFLSEEVVRLKS